MDGDYLINFLTYGVKNYTCEVRSYVKKSGNAKQSGRQAWGRYARKVSILSGSSNPAGQGGIERQPPHYEIFNN